MNFTCERPYAFYGLLLIIPAVIITFFQYRKIIRNKSVFMTDKNNSIASIANGRYFEAQTLNDLSLALLVITKNESTVQTYHSRTTSVEYYDKLISISGAFLVLAWILRRLYLKEFI